MVLVPSLPERRNPHLALGERVIKACPYLQPRELDRVPIDHPVPSSLGTQQRGEVIMDQLRFIVVSCCLLAHSFYAMNVIFLLLELIFT